MTTRKKKSRVIYPGTFDPITNGHLSLIERACHLFDELIVAVAKNGGKNPLFNFNDRIKLIEQTIRRKSFNRNVTVIGFDGLLADFAVKNKAQAIVRGLRAVSDFEIEFQMALMNRKLARDVETVFLMPSLSWVYLSSTIVRDVARHGGDISGLVPRPVWKAFNLKIETKK
ncbi:MAG: pantetheine-phosphate adenylyltransferase [Candidatus Zixiibacteriota bacterium]|nr:MAG: pantetheine-phosphate adenylyltransferase [candidate division Zixibacteria bacterium]